MMRRCALAADGGRHFTSTSRFLDTGTFLDARLGRRTAPFQYLTSIFASYALREMTLSRKEPFAKPQFILNYYE